MSSLEIPKEESAAPKQAEAPREEPKKESQQVPKEERTSTPPARSDAKDASRGKASKQTYPLYPSVQHLLEVNGLAKGEADKIPATGPNGRLLKGDVLAYIGKIQDSYPSRLAERFEKLAHLDLSNIKVAPKKESPKKPAEAAKASPVTEDFEVDVVIPLSLTAVVACQKRVEDSIGVHIPLSTFIERATQLANEDLPKPATAKPSADELFNAVLGLDRVASKYSRGHFAPVVTPLLPVSAFKRKPDVLDILAGKPLSRKTKAPVVGGAEHVVSLSVPKADEKRGLVFIERFRRLLEVDTRSLVI